MNKTNTTALLSLWLCSVFSINASETISLQQAVKQAQNNDPWLHGSRLKQSAVESRSVASSTLPDPKISIDMMNLPIDSLNFSQEAMTQFKVSVSQILPRGDTLAINKERLKKDAMRYPLLREDRKAKLKRTVSELWLDAYLAQQTIMLIENDRALFEQMVEVAKASYSSTIGKTRQQDVIRAQLELIQLEDRLTVQSQMYETSIARLNEWLHVYDETQLGQTFNFDKKPSELKVSNTLPSIQLLSPVPLESAKYSRNEVARELSNHPAVQAISIKQQAAIQSITLAKQQYKPQWGVKASYGLRDDTNLGKSRSDLFSVGVTFDLPLFTEDKQDKQVAASIAESEAIKTEKLLLIKNMLSSVEKELRQLKRLTDRQSIYKQQLIKQTHDQAEASLTAYTNDDGDFSEVVRARIAELNARVSLLKINVDTLKAVARINYFFAQSERDSSITNEYSQPTLFVGE